MTTQVRSSNKTSSRANELTRLRQRLEETTPFEMGVTEYEGDTWQLMIALTSDAVVNVPEESSNYSWTGSVVETEKWLFLNVQLGDGRESVWSLGFDCNDSEALVFLRQLLRNGRLMVGFPEPSRATRLLGVADRLVKSLGEKLELYVPRWKGDFHKTEIETQSARDRRG